MTLSPSPGSPGAPAPAAPQLAASAAAAAWRHAVLVIHGIGQQQPFQPLDSFVRGLRDTLRADSREVKTTHRLLGRDEALDHGVRVEEVRKPDGAAAPLSLDVFEFYWAPLTQRKASFTEVVRWLAATGFTPVRRLAFNLPLLVRRAEKRAAMAQTRSPATPAPTAAEGGPLGLGRRLQRAQATASGNWAFWLTLEFTREIWRVIYVPLAAVGLAWLAATLVGRSGVLMKELPQTLGPALRELATRSGAVTAALGLVAAIAAIGLGLSIPEQIRDLVRLKRLEPRVGAEFAAAARRGYAGAEGVGFISQLMAGAAAGMRGARSAVEARMQWLDEVRARGWFLPLSALGFLCAAGVLAWTGLMLPARVPPPPSPIVHQLLGRLLSWDLTWVGLVLVVALVLKRVFIDYLADVALYTMADENSGFFQTRAAILKEATRKIRALLRDPCYTSVAIAGHSLGSVIGYDAINWLRVEAQLPPVDAAGGGRAAGAPVTAAELSKLKTFITFGSPLNKVIYFFRTKVKVYETVRAHIVQELHGFRQAPDLVTRGWVIADERDPIDYRLYWVNVYSPMDPVSARLVLFEDIDKEHRRWFLAWGKCHVNYWHDQKFYRWVLAALEHR